MLGQYLRKGKHLTMACLYLLSCVAIAGWMLASGPQPVPRQDTRITNAIISVLSRVALTVALWIVTELLRSHWGHILISGDPVKLRGLLLACGDLGSLSRMRYLHAMPTQTIKITAIIGAGVTLCMTLTSAGFKYTVMSGTAVMPFLGPDFPAICNYSLLNATTGYFCTGAANAVTVNTEWTNINAMNSGAGGNVVRYGNATTGWLSANVTLTSAPADIRLPSNAPPPWAAIDVSCRSATLELQSVGTNATSSNNVVVDGRLIDKLSIANMPSWNSQVHLYQQVNDTGPASSLCPWYIVVLSRDLQDGTSNVVGLSLNAVRPLGDYYLDLHGYGPVLQGLLGSAAYCNFSGSTGGTWPNISWPTRASKNVIIGSGPENGTLGMATLFLNYGPSWQYNPVSENSLPGGSVSYIANFTTAAPTFPIFIATYMRNQWALMMYSNNLISPFVTNSSYAVRTPPQLHIQATAILAIPLVALVFCIGCAITGIWMNGRLGSWYGRVDIAPWWLMKAVNVTPGLAAGEVNEKEFEQWAEQKYCRYDITGQGVNKRGVLEF